MKAIKISIIVLIFALLFLELINSETQLIKSKSLAGVFVPSPKPELSATTWLNGTYQSGYSKYFDEQLSFHSDLVRLRNQIDYSIFDKANGGKIVIGKDDFLFQDFYTQSYIGNDTVDEKKVDGNVCKLSFIQKELAKKNCYLLFVISPSKAYYYEDKLPDQVATKKSSITNITRFEKYLEKYDVAYININSWFAKAKDTTAYPLFPKYGTHWSWYGAALAGDSIFSYFNSLSKRNDFEFAIEKGVTSEIGKETDMDLYNLLNIVKRPKPFKLYYPELHFVEKPDSVRPHVLFVGTSYLWNLMGINPFSQKLCNRDFQFWYYNYQIYSDYYKEKTTVDMINIKDIIQSRNYILVESNPSYLKDFNSGFVDEVYKMLKAN